MPRSGKTTPRGGPEGLKRAKSAHSRKHAGHARKASRSARTSPVVSPRGNPRGPGTPRGFKSPRGSRSRQRSTTSDKGAPPSHPGHPSRGRPRKSSGARGFASPRTRSVTSDTTYQRGSATRVRRAQTFASDHPVPDMMLPGQDGVLLGEETCPRDRASTVDVLQHTGQSPTAHMSEASRKGDAGRLDSLLRRSADPNHIDQVRGCSVT